jgi:hypothetical protein
MRIAGVAAELNEGQQLFHLRQREKEAFPQLINFCISKTASANLPLYLRSCLKGRLGFTFAEQKTFG